MATYFPSSNNQREATPMLYLRDPTPTTYHQSQILPGNVMMYMNYSASSSSSSYSGALPASNHLPNTCMTIPTLEPPESESSQPETIMGDNDFNLWQDGRNEMVLMPSLPSQRLSLSLRPQDPYSVQYRANNPEFSSFLMQNPSISGDENSPSKQSGNSNSVMLGFQGNDNPDLMKGGMSPYGVLGASRMISNSKYLIAAQQLLNEVVNVRKALRQHDYKKELGKDLKEGGDGGWNSGADSNTRESAANELSAAEKQELQNKLTKLLTMLDEVDRRYKQYYHQMQVVVSLFDAIAGCGSAKPYTSLALQTISCHFRCLHDAINGQIKITQKGLGEPDSSPGSKGIGISRLRYVDQQIRQQRALQQLGMMQQHTWRPQRGLPESSVSILRAWLFEHFLHPYPKDSDKLMLARQTGLTRSQVSNWFINARVRLWKPMVEEMYNEEAGDTEMESNSSSEMTPRVPRKETKESANNLEEDAQTKTDQRSNGQFNPDVDMIGMAADSTFQAAARANCSLLTGNGDAERLMAAYRHVSGIGRLGGGTGVSLTLGLQNCDTNYGYVGTRGEDVYGAGANPAGADASSFGSSPHLLHDFVA